MEITNRQNKYFNIAKSMAALSDFHRQHLGCVVVYKRKTVISVGTNQSKSHTLQALYNNLRGFDGNSYKACIHAEIDALSKIRYLDIDYSKVTLYIYRETADGKTAMARPCKACMGLIKNIGIKNIWYTTEFGYGHEKIMGE